MTGLVATAMIVGAVLINGTVVRCLWSWFIVPMGAAELSLPWAMGVALIVGYMTNHEIPKKNEQVDEWRVALNLAIRPAFAFGLGWLFSIFMP
jgi:uncharacterized membrane protein